MSQKIQPPGICDQCLGPIPPGQWRTNKRILRRYCSVECRNKANAIAGGPIISSKNRDRIRKGIWQNPSSLRPPTPQEQADRARKGRLSEVRDGKWRNPSLTPEARQKLSRPRKHSGALAEAIEKLGMGLRMADLTQDEKTAYRAYRAELRSRRRDEVNRLARLRYHRRKQKSKSDPKR